MGFTVFQASGNDRVASRSKLPANSETDTAVGTDDQVISHPPSLNHVVE
jgi:hypothetical protein